MATCYACGKDVLIVGRVGRNDVCEHCDQDLHCCRNCEFYDVKSNSECRERITDRIKDKDRANFCDFFKMGIPLHNAKEAEQISDAKRKLEELFKKKT